MLLILLILEAKRKAPEQEPGPDLSKPKFECKKSPLELGEEFIDEIKNDEKNINEQLFKEYFFIILHHFQQNNFFYHTPLFLSKELYNSNQIINDEIVKHINDILIKFKKNINRKKIPEN